MMSTDLPTQVTDISPVRKHILTVAIGAWGHITPLYELAKKIAKHHDVTFAVSAHKIPEMKAREMIRPDDLVMFYGIPDGIEKDLEDFSDKDALDKMFIQLKVAFEDLMSNLPIKNGPPKPAIFAPIDVAIVDCIPGAIVATSVPYYLFISASGECLEYILRLNKDTPTIEDATVFAFMRLPPPGEPMHAIPAFEKMIMLPLSQTVNLATGIIINSPRAIELDTVAEIEKHPSMDGLSLYCVGPLLPEERDNDSKHFDVERNVSEWLNGKERSSVVYVSFGSVPFAIPGKEQITIIAEALLATGQPFIWSLKKTHHAFLPAELKENISNQFDSKGNNSLVLPWAPQKLILAHDSVGIFLSHCGWNSTLEGLSSGTPFVAWPMLADQLLNGQRIVKLGVGILLPDTGIQSQRIVEELEIISALKEVGGWRGDGVTSSKYRDAALKWKSQVRDAWAPTGESRSEFKALIEFCSAWRAQYNTHDGVTS